MDPRIQIRIHTQMDHESATPPLVRGMDPRIQIRIHTQMDHGSATPPLVRGMDPRIQIRIHTKIMSRIRNTACLPHDDVAHLLEAGNDQTSVVVVEARSALLPTILQVAEVEEMHVCRLLEKEAVALKHLCFD
jgi:hypothetical protein